MYVLASYPKSGRSWLSLLLDTYRSGQPVQTCPRVFTPDGKQYRNTHDKFRPKYAKAAGVIYVHRNYCDVCVSLAAHCGISYNRAVQAMVNGCTLGKYNLGTYANHKPSWLRSGLPVLLIAYEQMLEDPAKELQKAVQFLGWEVDQQRTRFAVAQCRFEHLQQVERTCGFYEKPRRGQFFRCGRAGDGSRKLTRKQQRQLIAGLSGS